MAGTWVPTGAMFDARWAHTATLLHDGRVLVAGGNGAQAGATRQSAELYDPQTAEWTRTAAMHDPRWLHTATLLQDGRVLVAGGCADPGVGGGSGGSDFPQIPVLATAELFAPETATWQRMPDLQVTHAEHAALLLPDGRVLIVDGVGDGDDRSGAMSLSTLEWFDPATQSWSVRNRGLPRCAATSTLLANGRLLLLGGDHVDIYDGEGPVRGAQLYDQEHDTFGNPIELENPRAWHTATPLSDGTVLLVGGATRTSTGVWPDLSFQYAQTPVEERYDPDRGQLRRTASLQERRHRHTATLLQDGTVLVAGGNSWADSADPSTSRSLTSSARYQILAGSPPSDGVWTPAGTMLDARGGHTSTLLGDGTVLVAGGLQLPEGGVLYAAERHFPDVELGGCLPAFARAPVAAARRLLGVPSRLVRG